MMVETTDGIAVRLKDFLASQFKVDKDSISEDLSFGDLPQWDSLGHMSLMAAIEDQFGVEVNADAIADLVNYKAILGFLQKSIHG
jgi:acyl carrier protein